MIRRNRVKFTKQTLVSVVLLLLLGTMTMVAGATGDPSGDSGVITVHKFEDVNGDGDQDEGENDIEGWLIRVYWKDDTGVLFFREGTTGSDGKVTFDGLVPTLYKVWEEVRDCWEATTPPGMNIWNGGYYTKVYLYAGESVTVDFGNTYICSQELVGTGTPGYWMNHPEAWPVEKILVGDVTHSKDDAIALIKAPVKKDKTFTMFAALVAAKLNVLNGTDASCIAGTIAAADAWFIENGPVGSNVPAKSDAWKEGEPLYFTLDAYNNGLLCAPSRDSLE